MLTRLLTCVGIPSLLAPYAFAATVTDFHALAQQCAPGVPSETLAPIVKVESHFNPYAIGVVGGRLERQPRNHAEAVATAKALETAGLKFSAGIGQVFYGNWAAYGLTAETVFDACGNLRASSAIFQSCLTRAKAAFPSEHVALQAAYSCYYSNNFSTGFKPDFEGQPSYVEKVLASAAELQNQQPPEVKPIPFIPAAQGQAQKPKASPASAEPAPRKPVGPEQVVFDPLPAAAPAAAARPEPAASEPVKVTATTPEQASSADQASPYVYAPGNAAPADATSALVY